MTSPIDRIARSAAQRLAREADLPALVPEVERQLQAGPGTRSPDRYDPITIAISLAALLVSAAELAWNVYTDLKEQTPRPEPEVIKRKIRVELELPEQVTSADSERIISAVVEGALSEITEAERR
jgi:hypothetical protein